MTRKLVVGHQYVCTWCNLGLDTRRRASPRRKDTSDEKWIVRRKGDRHRHQSFNAEEAPDLGWRNSRRGDKDLWKERGVQVATENFSSPDGDLVDVEERRKTSVPSGRERERGGGLGKREERRLAEPGGEAPTTTRRADSALRRATSSPTRALYVCRPQNKIAPADRPTISRRRCSCVAVK